jgi:hypothetical protein
MHIIELAGYFNLDSSIKKNFIDYSVDSMNSRIAKFGQVLGYLEVS